MSPLYSMNTHKSLVLGEICDINFEGLTKVNSKNLSYKVCLAYKLPVDIISVYTVQWSLKLNLD